MPWQTQEIVDKCDAEIIKGKFLPTYPKLDGLSEDDYFKVKEEKLNNNAKKLIRALDWFFFFIKNK